MSSLLTHQIKMDPCIFVKMYTLSAILYKYAGRIGNIFAS